MKTVGISQPTYLPWLGYFDLMDQVDEFVLLDNVQFERHSWQHRNRIKGPSGELLLVVPVKRTGVNTLLADAEIADTRQLLKHRKAIEQAYARAAHRGVVLDALRPVLEDAPDQLLDLTVPIIVSLGRLLGISTPIRHASDLEAGGRKDGLVRAICEELGAEEYLSAPGSRGYLEAGSAFADSAIQIRYHTFAEPEYPQLHPPFISHLSAVDVLMCLGPEEARAHMLRSRGAVV